MSQQELADAILNEPVKRAGHAYLNMIKQTMPRNADAATQAAWWNSLTPAQRTEYMRAAPVELYDMKGIPADVKQQMAGTGSLNRIEMIRWAEKYGTSDHTDVPGMNNCANFVSYAMRDGGGLSETNAWQENHTGLPKIGPEIDPELHSATWGAAKNQFEFMLNHGQSVPVSEARPGDLVYLRDNHDNNIHHAAIVTAVTPDGQLMVTQHNTNHANIDLNDRLPTNGIRTGQNDVPLVVRPNPTWD